MADIFREVDEELRREGIVKLWHRYGTIVIAAVLAVILAIAGYKAWEYYTAQQRLDRARAYATAVAAIGVDDAAAIQALQELATGDDGYAALAYLQAAALKAKAGQTADAITVYRTLAEDSGIDPVFRDFAIIMIAAQSVDTATPEEIAARLEPLTGPENPWRFSAKELLALAALRAGDNGRATELYRELADDLEAPPNLRGRATEMLAALEG